ncbi:zinc transport system substrate-binding protein [Pilibacter termitis]|uniref:Zinc transport system substrate-binding protein n=1 Tax=Pilibacter termitis TaxID=263852 RepID=A0A1T4QYJ2_9ENTE|nr:zinc ABC transporter substrate-binding protein AdcA [Pilibacter termitis]SKA08531.1 zinc transport system substrate-binding protein [Pilibacter termitis]
MEKILKKIILSFVALGAFCTLAACGGKKAENTKDEVRVMTTFYPMYDFTKNIVGDSGKVDLLIPAGVEPHDFEPTAKDMAKIQEAKVFVYNSKYFEGWVKNAENSSKDVTFVEATKGISLMEGESDGHDHGEDGENFDPHVWLSPKLAKKEVEVICSALVKAYPKQKETFEKNAKEYLSKLSALDEEYTKELSNAKQKDLVTQHAAFGYLARDYGLNQVSISGLSPDEEPSPTRLAELKKYVEKNHISFIYFEENASNKIAKTLADEAKVKLAVLNPLESLTEKEQKAGENYLSVMKENLKNLKLSINNESENTGATSLVLDAAHGVFEESEVKARTLADWEGEWQSVYPYLEKGALDEVFKKKAEENKDKTAEEYKEYYTTGYKTDVEKITIKGNTFTFVNTKGKESKAEYKSAGFKILTYESGKKGVRYLFDKVSGDEEAPKFVQFSDHIIQPEKAEHYHLYMGNVSQEKLLEELHNWPTYYPEKLSEQQILDEMLGH